MQSCLFHLNGGSAASHFDKASMPGSDGEKMHVSEVQGEGQTRLPSPRTRCAWTTPESLPDWGCARKQLEVQGQGGSWLRSHCSTSRWPCLQACRHDSVSQGLGGLRDRKNCSMFVRPYFAAQAQVEAARWAIDGRSKSHSITGTCPLAATASATSDSCFEG